VAFLTRWSTIPTSRRSRAAPSIRPRPTFCRRTRDAGAHHQCTLQRPAISRPRADHAGGSGQRPRPPISAISTASCSVRIRAKVSCAGRRFLHPKLGFTFTAPGRFCARQHRAGECSGHKARRRPGACARCRARAGGADPRRLSDLRLDREHRARKPSTTSSSKRFPRRHRRGERRSVGFRSMPSATAATSTASSSRQHRTPRSTACFANRSARSAAWNLAEIEQAKPLHLVWQRSAGRHGGEAWQPHGG